MSKEKQKKEVDKGTKKPPKQVVKTFISTNDFNELQDSGWL